MRHDIAGYKSAQWAGPSPDRQRGAVAVWIRSRSILGASSAGAERCPRWRQYRARRAAAWGAFYRPIGILD